MRDTLQRLREESYAINAHNEGILTTYRRSSLRDIADAVCERYSCDYESSYSYSEDYDTVSRLLASL